MSLKGNYLTGNLACQNLGDCSFCFVPTIVEDKAVMAKRLMLCARTLRILETGLKMLAIEPLEKM